MRKAFQTAPKDGKIVILEDDDSGILEAARWSAAAGEWVGENGEPIKITPTHWYQAPAPRKVIASCSVVTASVTLEALPGGVDSTPHARERSVASSIAATIIDRYACRYGIFGISMVGIIGISMIGSMMSGHVAEQAPQLASDETSSFSRETVLQQRSESDDAAAQVHAQGQPQSPQSTEKEEALA